MWNKKQDQEDTRQKQTAPPPAPASLPRSAEPVAAASRPPMPDAPRTPAVLGKSVIVKGQIFSQEDLTIDGEVDGTVTAEGHRLTIGPNGKLTTNGVKAREVIVMGKMTGSVEATEKVYIRKDAHLVGDVQTAGIIIEDGAYFKGGIDIRKP
jgi:cytoskeletal protein CcmA (bactofilin family)